MNKIKKVLIFATFVTMLTCLLCMALNAETYRGTFKDLTENQSCTHVYDSGRLVVSEDRQSAYVNYTCALCSDVRKENYTGYYLDGDMMYRFADGGNQGMLTNTFVIVNGNVYYVVNNNIVKNRCTIDGKTYDFGNDGILRDDAETDSRTDNSTADTGNVDTDATVATEAADAKVDPSDTGGFDASIIIIAIFVTITVAAFAVVALIFLKNKQRD